MRHGRMDYDTLGYGCMGWAIGLCIANGWHMVYPTNGQMRHKLTHQANARQIALVRHNTISPFN